MKSLYTVLVDVNSSPCSSWPCENLPTFLSQTFDTTEVCKSTFLPQSVGGERIPDVIIVKGTPAGVEHELIDSIKTRWENTPIFCIFCGKMPNTHARNIKMLEDLVDFIYCPFQKGDLLLRLKRMIHRRGQASRVAPTLTTPNSVHIEGLVGASKVFNQAIEKIHLFADSNAPVLITGETGTGKELFARAIHYHSKRLSKPFIPVNCGALPDHLLENELFGHAKGAYTDASVDQKGLVAEAEGGTLFLDEVDTLSSPGQIKLLRFLQDQKYRPLGSSRALTANVRILCATNSDLDVLVANKQFREDLFYRLNVLSLCIPPVRLRSEDIPLLIKHFITLYARDTASKKIEFSTPAIRKLLMHSWPGNVRELEAVIHRAIILRPGTIVNADDLELPISQQQSPRISGQFQEAKINALNTFERTYLSNLLAEFQGNVSHAARAAGKERRSFQRLLKKHGLQRQAFATTKPIH